MTQHPFQIAPSILAADFTRLGEEVRAAEAAGGDQIHIDVMDGHFVPNLTMGPLIVEAVRRVTRLPLDVHLMIERPDDFLKDFAEAGATTIDVHVETCHHLHRTIQRIRELGMKPGVALNPHTPFELIREILPDVDRVLVMTVNPGFGGQTFIHNTLHKLIEIRQAARILQRDAVLEIGVDGGIDAHTAPEVLTRGANVLIAGSAIFKAKAGIAAGIAALRAVLPVKG
ncbi:MAG: ribulose-phosphate 3-epimerase [Aggregatilineales bacterium]